MKFEGAVAVMINIGLQVRSCEWPVGKYLSYDHKSLLLFVNYRGIQAVYQPTTKEIMADDWEAIEDVQLRM